MPSQLAFLQQGLSVQLRISSGSQQASCLSLSSARVIGLYHLAHRYRASSLRMFLRAPLAQSWVACVTGQITLEAGYLGTERVLYASSLSLYGVYFFLLT